MEPPSEISVPVAISGTNAESIVDTGSVVSGMTASKGINETPAGPHG